MLKRLGVMLVLLLLCGCFKVKDELTVNADGSGTVRIETRSGISPDMLGGGMMQMADMSGNVMYPPVTEEEAKKFFPGKEFTVKVKTEKAGEDTVTTVEAAFKDINALLNSPYGRAHQLVMKIENQELTVKGITGVEGVARLAEFKDEPGMGQIMPMGLAEIQKRKDEMRVEFRVTLPNQISTGNGAREGKTSAWIFERTKTNDVAEFATQLATVCETRCSADGLKMTPASPIRMALVSFGNLSTAEGQAAKIVDTNKIINAAKYVPYALQVTRSVDLSGEGDTEDSGAVLFGAIVLPVELKPQKWGEAKLEEAVDAKGNNLKPEESENNSRMEYTSRRWMGRDEENEESEKNPNEVRHEVTFNFKSPEWKVREIARVQGTVDLKYFSGSQIVKLTNAIPSAWIIDQSKMMEVMRSGSEQKKLSDPTLSKIGLDVSLQMGMAQSGATILMLEVSGKDATLQDAQAFDADGKPWPTFFQDSGFGSGGGDEEAAYVVMIAGRPRPPLSLAFQASGSGASVTVPIKVERIPVNAK